MPHGTKYDNYDIETLSDNSELETSSSSSSSSSNSSFADADGTAIVAVLPVNQDAPETTLGGNDAISVDHEEDYLPEEDDGLSAEERLEIENSKRLMALRAAAKAKRRQVISSDSEEDAVEPASAPKLTSIATLTSATLIASRVLIASTGRNTSCSDYAKATGSTPNLNSKDFDDKGLEMVDLTQPFSFGPSMQNTIATEEAAEAAKAVPPEFDDAATSKRISVDKQRISVDKHGVPLPDTDVAYQLARAHGLSEEMTQKLADAYLRERKHISSTRHEIVPPTLTVSIPKEKPKPAEQKPEAPVPPVSPPSPILTVSISKEIPCIGKDESAAAVEQKPEAPVPPVSPPSPIPDKPSVGFSGVRALRDIGEESGARMQKAGFPQRLNWVKHNAPNAPTAPTEKKTSSGRVRVLNGLEITGLEITGRKMPWVYRIAANPGNSKHNL